MRVILWFSLIFLVLIPTLAAFRLWWLLGRSRVDPRTGLARDTVRWHVFKYAVVDAYLSGKVDWVAWDVHGRELCQGITLNEDFPARMRECVRDEIARRVQEYHQREAEALLDRYVLEAE